MISQIRRAALSVHLNIAEGSSRSSLKERKRYFEIAGGSLIEIDTALDIADSLSYLIKIETSKLSDLVVRCFKILSRLINIPDTPNHSPFTIHH
jgi:four helix bundle protein